MHMMIDEGYTHFCTPLFGDANGMLGNPRSLREQGTFHLKQREGPQGELKV